MNIIKYRIRLALAGFPEQCDHDPNDQINTLITTGRPLECRRCMFHLGEVLRDQGEDIPLLITKWGILRATWITITDIFVICLMANVLFQFSKWLIPLL